VKEGARIKRARGLRAEATDVERKLWSVLRNRQLGGAKFRRQYPVDRYFADFACVESRLIVELDGGQHDAQSDYDARRTEILENCGWKVVRFWNNEVIENLDGVADTILHELGRMTP
jgi:very-short-patch-repair endonuclease